MFGVGFSEMLVILILGLVVFGPEQIPQLSRTLGKLMTDFRRAKNNIGEVMREELAKREEFKEIKKAKESLDQEFHEMATRSVGYLAQEAEATRRMAQEAIETEARQLAPKGGVSRPSGLAAAAKAKPAKKGAAKPKTAGAKKTAGKAQPKATPAQAKSEKAKSEKAKSEKAKSEKANTAKPKGAGPKAQAGAAKAGLPKNGA